MHIVRENLNWDVGKILNCVQESFVNVLFLPLGLWELYEVSKIRFIRIFLFLLLGFLIVTFCDAPIIYISFHFSFTSKVLWILLFLQLKFGK